MKKKTKIGIFEGRKRQYNLAVLETLFVEGLKKSWAIAKTLCRRLGQTTDENSRYGKTQKIYSLLIRKKGRLQELEEKGYIAKDDETGEWWLSFKGVLAVLLNNPQSIKHIYPVWLDNKFKIDLEGTNNFSEEEKILFKDFCEGLKLLFTPNSLLKIAEATERVLSKFGVDLDTISNKALVVLLLYHDKPIQQLMETAFSNFANRLFSSDVI